MSNNSRRHRVPPSIAKALRTESTWLQFIGTEIGRLVKDAVKDAVSAEREDCAKIAENSSPTTAAKLIRDRK